MSSDTSDTSTPAHAQPRPGAPEYVDVVERAATGARRPLAAPRALPGVVRAFSRHWVLELSVFAMLAVAYNVVRGSSSLGDADPFSNARQVLAAEGPVFELLEQPLNHWLSTIPLVAVVCCYLYAVLHYAATPLVFFLSRHRGGWRYWRGYWALIIGSGLALVIYALYPVAPPRLMPGLGTVDILREFSEFGWWGSAASAPRGIGDATNQFAAMPSMHFGWALWCSIQLWGFGSRPWRVIAVLYPTVLTFVVLATGNHFVLDVVGGAACILVGYAVVEAVGRRLERARVVREAASGP